MVDPRIYIVEERLRNVRNIIAVSSGKGGVGKSLVASTLALILAKHGYNVGLFDLDFTSPSTHIILGIKNAQPKEEHGIIPAQVHGLKYMSIIYYSGECATPLRGADSSNALLELLATTIWGNLDFLILDMPPGIGDATLDLIRLIKNIKFLIVTTSSQLAYETVKKLTSLLKEMNIQIIGIIENMVINKKRSLKKQVEKLGMLYLGNLFFDRELERTIGNVDALMITRFVNELKEIVPKIEEQ